MVPRRMVDSPDTKSCKDGQGRHMQLHPQSVSWTQGTALLVPPAEGELSPKASVPWGWAGKGNIEYPKEPVEN